MPKHKHYEEEPTEDNGIRLNRYLGNSGVSTRREADKLIDKGLVTVNGKVVTEMGYRVQKGDKVVYEGQYLNAESKQFILLNKTKNCTVNKTRGKSKRSVYDNIRYVIDEFLYPIDMMDENTTGVLIMTNDKEMMQKINSKRSETYHIFLNKEMAEADLKRLMSGIKIDDRTYKARVASYSNDNDKKEIGIEITNSPVNAVLLMLKKLGYGIERIDRVLFNGLSKKNVSRGNWRFLTKKEIHFLQML